MSNRGDFNDLDDEQLDQLRRDVLKEKERRQRVGEGAENVGALIRSVVSAEYPDFAPDVTDEELGTQAIEAATGRDLKGDG